MSFFQAIFNSSTLIFLWHCFYWLVQCGFYSFQNNQTFATVWNCWCKLKLWPHSGNGCNFVLDFTLYHKVFAVLQKECLSSMSCVFIWICFTILVFKAVLQCVRINLTFGAVCLGICSSYNICKILRFQSNEYFNFLLIKITQIWKS